MFAWIQRRLSLCRLWVVLALLAPPILALCATPAAAQGDAVPRIEPGECVVPVPADGPTTVDCGTLIVPEDHNQPDNGHTIRLPYAVIHSTAENPAPDPYVYPTNGGPGANTLSALPFYLQQDWLLDRRDVVMMEQRGTGYAEPDLQCPEFIEANLSILGQALKGDEALDRFAQGAAECYARLTDEGIDLAAYNGVQSAADLADLRRLLGYDEWNLYGGSYGGRLAQTVMRTQPDGLRSVILDSPEGLAHQHYEAAPRNFALSLERLFESCAADPGCAAAYPDPHAQLVRVVERLDAEPLSVTFTNPRTGEPFTLLLDGQQLLAGVFDALYGPALSSMLPYLIDQIDRGNAGVVMPMTPGLFDTAYSLAWGMYFSVECQDDWPFNDPAAVQAAIAEAEYEPSLTKLRITPTVCAVWDVPPADPAEDEPVVSDIPTLILAGYHDPIVPNESSRAIADTLSHAYYVEFPTLSHGPLGYDCPNAVVDAFLDDPTTAPDTSCIAEMPPLDFPTTADIYTTPGFFRLNSAVMQGGSPLQIALAAVCLGSFVLGGGATAVTLARRKPRFAPPEQTLLRAAQVSALLVALLNLAFVVALLLLAPRTDMLILAFGLPMGAAPLLLLPALAVVGYLALIGVVVVAWRRGCWPRGLRLLFSEMALAGAAFALWLASLGLLTLPR